jgi:hypothetical protein
MILHPESGHGNDLAKTQEVVDHILNYCAIQLHLHTQFGIHYCTWCIAVLL